MSKNWTTKSGGCSMVVPVPWVKKVDDWRRREPDLPNLSEAIRRLVEMGLESAKKGKGR